MSRAKHCASTRLFFIAGHSLSTPSNLLIGWAVYSALHCRDCKLFQTSCLNPQDRWIVILSTVVAI